jgi:hypothetical protein
MKYQYTVVLVRPDYIADKDLPCDVYLAHIEADYALKADEIIAWGRADVCRADLREKLNPQHPNDYAPLFVLSGHITPLLWSWDV